MSTPSTPSKRRSLTRVPSMGSSFASCFGASTPISPQRSGRHGLLGGQACVNYRRLGFDEDEDEDDYTYTREAAAAREEENNADDMYEQEGDEPYASEHEAGDDEHVRESKLGMGKLGKLWCMREKDTICYTSETPKKQAHYHGTDLEEAGVYVRERKGVMKLSRLWTMRGKARRGECNARETSKEEHNASEEEGEECGRERNGGLQNGKHMMSMRGEEKMYGGSPRRESLCRKVRGACVQVLESARRSSPHLSELFVGNQLLMQVTSSSSLNARRARMNVARPSAGFLVTGDPPLTISPHCSSSSPTF